MRSCPARSLPRRRRPGWRGLPAPEHAGHHAQDRHVGQRPMPITTSPLLSVRRSRRPAPQRPRDTAANRPASEQEGDEPHDEPHSTSGAISAVVRAPLSRWDRDGHIGPMSKRCATPAAGRARCPGPIGTPAVQPLRGPASPRVATRRPRGTAAPGPSRPCGVVRSRCGYVISAVPAADGTGPCRA